MTEPVDHGGARPAATGGATTGPATPRRQGARDYTVGVWLLAAAGVALAHRAVPEPTWLMVHLVLLGAVTHAVLVWSQHFSVALLKTRPDAARARWQRVRLVTLSAGSAAVLVGVPTARWWLVVAGATVVSGTVAWHGMSLVVMLREALPGRFRVAVRYYVAAACFLPVGAGFGATLAVGLDSRWHGRFLVAHTMTNLLGWIGLTVVGTLVTFWPTVLRTRMDERAEASARRFLPVLAGAVVVVAVGALAGQRYVALAGLAGYLAGLVGWGRTLVGPLRRRRPREFAPASILAAMCWAVVALGVTGWVVLVTGPDGWDDAAVLLGLVWVGGFAIQLLTGALSYLLPSVLGGGPSVVRAAGSWFDRFASARLVVINGALLLVLAPVPPQVATAAGVAGVVAAATFLPLMALGVRAGLAERAALVGRATAGRTSSRQQDPPLAASAAAPAGVPAAAARSQGRSGEPPSALTVQGVLVGSLVLALAVTAGLWVDRTGAPGTGPAGAASSAAGATGRTVRVDVRAEGMRFVPDHVVASAGDRVVVVLTNADPTMAHDLAVGARSTPRLGPGQTAELDLGVVSETVSGWCTVVGHRQAGMTFEVRVGHHHGSGRARADSAPLGTVVDPRAPTLPAGTLHQVEMRVSEVPLEVAPGVWQRRWTFNGGPVGPTLRGRVGDVFEVTLVNDGTMGHSIDFHASNLAPDRPMRTIGPGESLVYRFTAQRAGIWMYHCGTAPVSAHIAAGMHGAVIIEPEGGFPTVDREYVVVASEVYLAGGTGGDQAAAADVDAARAQTPDPDYATFNGVAFQYVQRPFEARTGERVRFWVLAAGPNLSTSFHIVGGQFHTVYAEGGYRLRDGRDPFGGTGGGAQALGLEAAQGGFVELTFPEAGRYPVVDHAFLDAERGALGTVVVTD